MSVHVVSWVLQHSEERLGRRLVLLVLADHARSDGTAAWPSVAVIAHEARMGERQVQRCLHELLESGAIVRTGVSRSGTNVYTVAMETGDKMSPPTPEMSPPHDENVTPGVSKMSPEPSLNHPTFEPNGSNVAPVPKPRPRNLVWDACEVIWGSPANEAEKGRRTRAVKLFKQALAAGGIAESDALPEIRARFNRYCSRYDQLASPSDVALAGRWSECKPTPAEFLLLPTRR